MVNGPGAFVSGWASGVVVKQSDTDYGKLGVRQTLQYLRERERERERERGREREREKQEGNVQMSRKML